MADNLKRRSEPNIDLQVDVVNRKACYRGKTFRLSELEAKMLECAVSEYPNEVRLPKLYKAVGRISYHKIRDRLEKKLRGEGLGLQFIPYSAIRLIEQSQSSIPLIEVVLDEQEIRDQRPFSARRSTLVSKDVFAVSIDGISLNSASELLHGLVTPSRIRNCQRLYRSALEDFAFAVAYGSRISSKWRRPYEAALDLGVDPQRAPEEPAELLISQLEPGIYDADIKDERYLNGRVLEIERDRRQISQYIRSFSKAFKRSKVKQICQEWLVREADTYLGDDPSLLESSHRDDPLQFGKEYYRSSFLDEVPSLLGQDTLDTLTGFLPITPPRRGERDRYSLFARQQFVLRNVMTHLTIMYEYERTAVVEGAQRLPFILRGEVKREWHKEHFDEGELRTLLIRSALDAGLRECEDAYSPEDLVTRLFWIRNQSTFIRMRSRLDELSAMVRQQRSEEEQEKKRSDEIRKLISEIRHNSGQGNDSLGRVDVSRNTVTPDMIRSVEPETYIARLYRFFPHLKPASIRSGKGRRRG